MKGLPQRVSDLLPSRIMEDLPKEDGHAATSDRSGDRLAIQYAEDEGQRHDTKQEGR